MNIKVDGVDIDSDCHELIMGETCEHVQKAKDEELITIIFTGVALRNLMESLIISYISRGTVVLELASMKFDCSIRYINIHPQPLHYKAIVEFRTKDFKVDL